MKKWHVLSMFLYLSACADSQQPQLKVYNQAAYILDKIYAEFKKEMGIKITLGAIASCKEFYAKIRSLDRIYGLVALFPNYVQISREPIDAANIPNINPRVLSNTVHINLPHCPVEFFAYAPAITAHNTEYTGRSIFENPKYGGRMLLTLINGFSPRGTPETPREAAKKPDYSSALGGFPRAMADGVGGCPETIWTSPNEKKRHTVKFAVLHRGGAAHIDSFMVLRHVAQKKEAEIPINFIHHPDIYARICDGLHPLGINLTTQALIKKNSLISHKDLSNTTVLKAIFNLYLTAQPLIWGILLAN